MRILRAALSGAVVFAAVARPVSAAPCDSLKAVALPHTSITAAAIVPTGTFVPPRTPDAPPGGLPPATSMPEICRVQVIRSATNGYATSSTDTGHKGSPIDAAWALGHLEKVADYGHRAIHETAVTAKALINAFYGAAPRFSYFNACSNGGRAALMEPNQFGTWPVKGADPKVSVSAAIEQWVETGTAPGAIIATKFKRDGDRASGVLRTRPLCAYPQVAKYKGTGSTDDAANFECRNP